MKKIDCSNLEIFCFCEDRLSKTREITDGFSLGVSVIVDYLTMRKLHLLCPIRKAWKSKKQTNIHGNFLA